MDINALHACFAATLVADPEARKQAELQLKSAEKTPGFINGCLDIVLEENVSPGVRSAAAIYLKNKVRKYWSPIKDDNKDLAIDPDEKPVFRERLLPALNKINDSTRPVMVMVLHGVVANDFPNQWPELLDLTMNLFHSNDIQYIRSGLTCLLEITRNYRWSSQKHREPLGKVVDMAFPGVLNVGMSLVNEDSHTAGEMMRDIMKIYKMATYIEMPVSLRQTDSVTGWFALFLSVIKKPFPKEVLDLDIEGREQHPWVKTKKWASWNVSRIFSRYVNGTRLASKGQEYAEFSRVFGEKFTPEILETYFAELTVWIEGNSWMAPETQYNIISFLEECAKVKESWKLLKPHAETVISHVIFPLLCPTDQDLELFEDEPEQYIHKQIDVFEESNTPDIAATSFLMTVMRLRKKSVFNTTLAFVQSIVSDQLKDINDLQLARKKDGALRMLSAMAGPILAKNSPIADSIENFVMQYVVGDFQSPFGFLRARVCAFINRFAEAKFSDKNNIALIYQNILKSMSDENLPVQVEASLALQPLIQHEDVRIALCEHIPQIMQHFLTLGDKIDMDALSGVMEEFVEVYHEQLTPFSIQLAEQMRDQFMRLANEILEKRDDDSSEVDDSIEDKAMAAVGILNTLGTLLMALDNDQATMTSIETLLLPIFAAVLGNKMIEFYSDALTLIENITYCLSRIDESMWEVYRLIGEMYNDSDAMDYLDDIEPVLQNYISYGKEFLAANPAYVNVIYKIYERTMLDTERMGAYDKSIACAIITRLMLSQKGNIDDAAWRIVSIAVDILNEEEDKITVNVAYMVNLLEVVIAGIYYNPVGTLALLDSKQCTDKLFGLWASKILKFSRVYDKKMCVLSLLSLLTMPVEQFSPFMATKLPLIIEMLTSLLETLPSALKHREELNNADPSSYYSDYENLGGSEDVWGVNDEEDEDEDKSLDASQVVKDDYLNFLANESSKMQNPEFEYWDPEEEEDLQEELVIETPLDNYNIFIITRDTLFHINQNDASRYQQFTSGLNPRSTKAIEQTIERATADEQKAAQVEAQTQQGQAGPSA